VTAKLSRDQQSEHGRFLVEELNCAKCHQPSDNDKIGNGLESRQSPDLSKVGERVYAGWIFRWLESPEQMRPGAVMPRMFSDDEAGRIERYALAQYLASLGGPIASGRLLGRNEIKAAENRGDKLFSSLGCVACHRTGLPKEEIEAPARLFYNLAGLSGKQCVIPLTGLGSKTNPEKLAKYLENPLTVDPSGRMPHILLQNREAQDLAWFLCQSKDLTVDRDLIGTPEKSQLVDVFRKIEHRASELTTFERLSPEAQSRDLGKRLVIDKGCNLCHTIAPGGKPFAAVLSSACFDDLKKSENQGKGCLADDNARRGGAPLFALSEENRKAIRQFLREGTGGAGSPAPAHRARVTLQRFNCLACHSRDGEGGLTSDLIKELRKFEKAENAEAVSPPPLTGVGHKLRTPWLKQVLVQAGRARPWMRLRMPQFGEANVGHLPDELAGLEGAELDDQINKVPLTSAKIEAGRSLIGKQAFGCISCHDLAGIANSGTRGPDLALMNQRVRYAWYRRWLEEAQRMQPGTRMPTIFANGKSQLDAILRGSADAQAEAMWAYLSLGPELPLPEGLDPPKGLIVEVLDRPVILRTFMPEAGSRAIAVGYPKGISLAFDAATCRLAYGWSGNFLDVSPVWDNRGGNPAKLLGVRFWTAPPGFPWAVGPSNDLPDFAALARDPDFRSAAPELQLYNRPNHLRFEGYETDRDGYPAFRYRLKFRDANGLEITERPAPLSCSAGTGVIRRFTLAIPSQQRLWFLAGLTAGEPRLFDVKRVDQELDRKSSAVAIMAGERWLLLPQEGERPIILHIGEAPVGARWHIVKNGNQKQILLQLPARSDAGRIKMEVGYWVPYRNDPELLKEIMTRE